jgi:hypothetical protein
LTWRGLNSNPGWFHFVFLLSLFHLENHVCLSHGVQVAGVAWRAATRIVIGVGDLVQRTEDGHTDPKFYFAFSRLGVCHELYFYSTN